MRDKESCGPNVEAKITKYLETLQKSSKRSTKWFGGADFACGSSILRVQCSICGQTATIGSECEYKTVADFTSHACSEEE